MIQTTNGFTFASAASPMFDILMTIAGIIGAISFITLGVAAYVQHRRFEARASKIGKAALIGGAVALLALIGGISFAAAAKTTASQQTHDHLIGWASDRYALTLDDATADALIDDDTIVIDGAGISLALSNDQSYYLIAGGAELPIVG